MGTTAWIDDEGGVAFFRDPERGDSLLDLKKSPYLKRGDGHGQGLIQPATATLEKRDIEEQYPYPKTCREVKLAHRRKRCLHLLAVVLLEKDLTGEARMKMEAKLLKLLAQRQVREWVIKTRNRTPIREEFARISIVHNQALQKLIERYFY